VLTTSILAIVFGLVDMFLSLLPTFKIPDGAVAGLGELSSIMSRASAFIPVRTVGICIGLWILMNNFSFVANLFNWLIRKIPFLK